MTLRHCRTILADELTTAIAAGTGSVAEDEEVFCVVFSHCGAQYRNRLPPDVSVGTVLTLRRMVAQ